MPSPSYLTSALLAFATVFSASAQEAQPEDVSSPEAIVSALYESFLREPGTDFDWERYRSLHLPEARLIPNTEQRGGEFSVLSPQEFIDWVKSATQIGGPNDRGFSESAVHNVIEEYGDIAHVFSTYKKHYWGEDEVLGRGINSIQLVKKGGRWWIFSVVWDEDYAGGEIPNRYLGG